MMGSSCPVSVPGYFGDEGVCSVGFWEEVLFLFLGKLGREGTTVHGVRVVFNSMSCLQTDRNLCLTFFYSSVLYVLGVIRTL